MTKGWRTMNVIEALRELILTVDCHIANQVVGRPNLLLTAFCKRLGLPTTWFAMWQSPVWINSRSASIAFMVRQPFVILLLLRVWRHCSLPLCLESACR